MGKPTGFLEYDRVDNKKISVKERIKNFDEFYDINCEEERLKQGARCMNCGVPFCGSAMELSGMVTGCPLHNLIPEWNDEIYCGNYSHGLARLLKTNPFPEFTGRVCPALCEKACVNGMHEDPVTIRDNELFLIERGFENGKMTPKIPQVRSDKSIAVIGSGPAGLAVAEKLNKRGHNVTVFERDDRFGGLLMYGIPNMKLDKSAILRRIELMEHEGVKFEANKNLGENISIEELESEFDAIVLCCGAKKARDLSLPNREAEGIYFAVDFLTDTTKSLLEKNRNCVSAKGKNVVVLGGGDTGNDCVGTCIRQGANSVVQIEMMPKAPDKRQESNPWPEWPKVCVTDYGQQEAIEVFGSDPRVYNTTIKEIFQTEGKLSGVLTVKVEFADGKLTEVAGTEQKYDADLLLIAAGFLGYEDYCTVNLEIPQKMATSYATNKENIFVCGDMKRGQSLVVWAIAEGFKCAEQVDSYILG